MAKQSKRRAPRAPFIVTVAATSAVALSALPGCGSSVDPGNGCPEERPASGAECLEEGQTCTFGSSVDSCGNADQMTCYDGQWSWTGSTCNPPPPPVCPEVAPNQGDPCASWEEGLSCEYMVDTGCGPMEAPATCEGGVWSVSTVTCNPPPPDLCYAMTTEADCVNLGACRWMTPGCADPSTPPLPLAQEGCFPTFDCASSAECQEGTTCEQRVYNPCYNQPCDACGSVAMLCVAP